MSLMSFLKKPSVLLGLGVLGFFATNVLTARATKKYLEKKEALGRETTLKEDIVLAAKAYAPAATAGIVSAGLIFGGNKTYSTAQAGLVTGYTLLNTKYKNYRDVVLKQVGLDQFKDLDKALSKEMSVKEAPKKTNKPEWPVSEGSITIRDPFSDPENPIWLETTMEQYLDANHEFMRKIIMNPYYEDIVKVNEWRELQGFNDFDMHGEEFGWSQEYLENVNGCIWLDISLEIHFDAKGDQYYEPVFRIEPCVGNSHQNHAL